MIKTDLENFVELYKSFGIDCVVQENENLLEIKLLGAPYSNDKGTHSTKFDGYFGFYSTVRFNQEGKFISQGFWE